MTGARTAVALALVAGIPGACGPDDGGEAALSRDVITTDTIDPDMVAPGVIFRSGPATAEAMAGPIYPPIVAGDAGQVSIHGGYFVQRPCSLPLQASSRRGDTITVRITSRPDTARAGTCPEDRKALGYALLTGQFEPGTYAVRLVHEGDLAREAGLDTVYPNITVRPREER